MQLESEPMLRKVQLRYPSSRVFVVQYLAVSRIVLFYLSLFRPPLIHGWKSSHLGQGG